MTSPQHFNLGPPAADNDPDLLSYYCATNQIKALLQERGPDASCIIAAPPGSGKTALLRWLKEGIHSFDVISIGADEFRPIPDDDKLTTEDIKLIIRYELPKFTLGKWLKLNRLGSEEIRSAYNRSEKSILKWIKDTFTDRFAGFSILAVSLALNPAERKQYLRELRVSGAATQMQNLLQSAATRERPLIIAVDNPEQILASGLDATDRRSALLTGALLHVLRGLQTAGVRVLALTRDNVLNSVKDYPDYGHFSDAITWLTWSNKDLLGVIEDRLTKRLQRTWDKVFGLTKSEFTKTVIPWVVDGPRDLILLCNNALRVGSKGIADLASFQHEKEALLDHKLTAVHGHYSTQYPRIREYVEAVAEVLAVTFHDAEISKKDLRARVVNSSREGSSKLFELKKDQGWIEAMNPRSGQIEGLLYDLGVIGVIDSTGRRYSWEGRTASRIKTAEQVFLSPLFQLMGEE